MGIVGARSLLASLAPAKDKLRFVVLTRLQLDFSYIGADPAPPPPPPFADAAAVLALSGLGSAIAALSSANGGHLATLKLDLTGNVISPAAAMGLSAGLGGLMQAIGVEILGVDFVSANKAEVLVEQFVHTTPVPLALLPSAEAAPNYLTNAGATPVPPAEVPVVADESAAAAILSAALAALGKGDNVMALNGSINADEASPEVGSPANPYQSESGGVFGTILMVVRVVFVAFALMAAAMFGWARIRASRTTSSHSARGFGVTSVDGWADEDEDQMPGSVRSHARGAYDMKGRGKGRDIDESAASRKPNVSSDSSFRPDAHAPDGAPPRLQPPRSYQGRSVSREMANQSRSGSRAMDNNVTLESMLAEQVRAL